jgi:hypothetical protein
MPDRNCLSTWFPRLLAAGLPVPQTKLVRTNLPLAELLDGRTPDGFDALLGQLDRAARAVGGYPAFLRTGQGSGKHRWKDTCHLRRPEDLARHVAALVEWSVEVDLLGLPTNVWAVRELLPVRPVAVLPRYGDMPLVKEIRAFVADGHRVCFHPYWPAQAIANGLAGRPGLLSPDEEAQDAAERLERAATLFRQVSEWGTEERTAALQLIDRVADVFRDDGAWSVDLLRTERGWLVIDMAEAARSFHWPGCPAAGALESAPPKRDTARQRGNEER